MFEQQFDLIHTQEIPAHSFTHNFHSSFCFVSEKLKKWLAKFSQSIDNSVFTDLYLFYLLATKKFLDHRISSHLFRLILSIHHMQKKLLHAATFFSHHRYLEIRLIPTTLFFPFSSKSVLGCLIGFNVLDRYELFDEENILLALQKNFSDLKLVKESSYYHSSQHKNLKMIYFEIEKNKGTSFSLEEQQLLKKHLENKVKNSIQTLSPTIFMRHNEEEIYKHILILSQEIKRLKDLPQAYIVLDQQTGKEIIFRIILAYISPFHRFSFKDYFFDGSFVSHRLLTVRHIENHPVEAHIFCLHLPRNASLLRSDGSLDFYSARQKVASLLHSAIGEFRDYNGGIIIKQQELLHAFKEHFPEIANCDSELIERFFYGLTPLEKQVVIQEETLLTLFTYFLENRKQQFFKDSTCQYNVYSNEQYLFFIAHGDGLSFKDTISAVLQDPSFVSLDIAYNFIDLAEGIFFNCVLQVNAKEANSFIQAVQHSLSQLHKKRKDQQILRIGVEFSHVSLDPRAGDTQSSNVLRLLFEGLTRFNKNGDVENAVAESITISSDLKQYIFKLHSCLWNDGSPVSAYDFEYAWKKILSPDFKTSFAYRFYPIKNAKEGKKGKLPLDQIGIHVLNERTLKIELERPTPSFLKLTAHPLFSPVHRLIDQQHPQWPYQCEKNYPCNGPFQLKVNQPNQGYQLIRNPFYWDVNQIQLDQITLTPMNPAQALQAFQSHEIDYIGNPFGNWYSIYNTKMDSKFISFPNSWVCWLVFNTKSPPFHHCKLRQAFAYAIQRTRIIANTFASLNPAFSPLLPYYCENHHPQFPNYDLERARQLLHEAIQELNLSLKDISPLPLIFLEKGVREHTAECLKQQFKECLDIECELKPLSWNALSQKMTKENFQLGLMQWTPWMDDPLYTLNVFKSEHHEVNFAKWEHPDFKHLIDLSEQEVTPFRRSFYLLNAEKIFCNEMPVIPLFYQASQALVHKDLQIIYKSPCGPFNIARSYYEKKE